MTQSIERNFFIDPLNTDNAIYCDSLTLKKGILKRNYHYTYYLINFYLHYTLLVISNTFISNARLKLAENQANAKQHSEAELLLFENYSRSSSTLSSKNNRTYSEK